MRPNSMSMLRRVLVVGMAFAAPHGVFDAHGVPAPAPGAEGAGIAGGKKLFQNVLGAHRPTAELAHRPRVFFAMNTFHKRNSKLLLMT